MLDCNDQPINLMYVPYVTCCLMVIRNFNNRLRCLAITYGTVYNKGNNTAR